MLVERRVIHMRTSLL